MAARNLNTVLIEFSQRLQECRQLSTAAHRLSVPIAVGTRPAINQRTRDQMTEMAFLRIFLAWESFVEESFILYLFGRRPPRGRAPHRYAFPPNFRTATEWVIPERRAYAEWTSAQEVSRRAERFFRDGRPFTPVLRSNQHMFEEIRAIRNAIAHRSASTRQKFEVLVRNKLGALPPDLTVGSFLASIVPGSAPPGSFLEFYFSRIYLAAQQIIPA